MIFPPGTAIAGGICASAPSARNVVAKISAISKRGHAMFYPSLGRVTQFDAFLLLGKTQLRRSGPLHRSSVRLYPGARSALWWARNGALGQKRRFRRSGPMSALTPIATVKATRQPVGECQLPHRMSCLYTPETFG